MAALYRALALPQMSDVAVRVADDLHFNVARIGNQPLDIHGIDTKRGLRLRAAAGIGFFELCGVVYRAHTAPASARHGLDHDTGARPERREKRLRFVQGDRPAAACQQGHTTARSQLPGEHLVTESLQRLDARAHEGDALLGAGTGERRVLAQETVARVQGVALGGAGRRHDGLHVQISARARAGQRNRLIGLTHMQRGGVISRIHRHRGHAE